MFNLWWQSRQQISLHVRGQRVLQFVTGYAIMIFITCVEQGILRVVERSTHKSTMKILDVTLRIWYNTKVV